MYKKPSNFLVNKYLNKSHSTSNTSSAISQSHSIEHSQCPMEGNLSQILAVSGGIVPEKEVYHTWVHTIGGQVGTERGVGNQSIPHSSTD